MKYIWMLETKKLPANENRGNSKRSFRQWRRKSWKQKLRVASWRREVHSKRPRCISTVARKGKTTRYSEDSFLYFRLYLYRAFSHPTPPYLLWGSFFFSRSVLFFRRRQTSGTKATEDRFDSTALSEYQHFHRSIRMYVYSAIFSRRAFAVKYVHPFRQLHANFSFEKCYLDWWINFALASSKLGFKFDSDFKIYCF